MRPREVFLSHATADKVVARRVLRRLESHGIPVWFAPYKLIGSQRWHDEIGKALQRCDWFLLLLSRSSVRSRWVKNELLFALNEPRLDDRIVPVLIEPCDWKEFSWTLGAIQHVDLTGDFPSGMVDLLRVFGITEGTQPADKPRRKRRRTR
jgi:hypothetical protein